LLFYLYSIRMELPIGSAEKYLDIGRGLYYFNAHPF